MIYGVNDVTKLNHFASAISSDGKELINPLYITNDANGFQLLSSHLNSLPEASFIIVLESTAHYVTILFVTSSIAVIKSVSSIQSRPLLTE